MKLTNPIVPKSWQLFQTRTRLALRRHERQRSLPVPSLPHPGVCRRCTKLAHVPVRGLERVKGLGCPASFPEGSETNPLLPRSWECSWRDRGDLLFGSKKLQSLVQRLFQDKLVKDLSRVATLSRHWARAYLRAQASQGGRCVPVGHHLGRFLPLFSLPSYFPPSSRRVHLEVE